MEISRKPFYIKIFKKTQSGLNELEKYLSNSTHKEFLFTVHWREDYYIIQWWESPSDCLSKIQYTYERPNIKKSISDNKKNDFGIFEFIVGFFRVIRSWLVYLRI